ncbi:hypothetical protein SAMN05444143_101921 [Flavobacterium succinicans]|uniref:Uncharacterized protein n=1 Tax=Flavobacterium succinicans TaxID=29536 RepID=A0A1I4SNV4_9FLAO|nr:hypothetical protein SAMN05444143_101921 [Flavobacterium succinicans]
MKYTVNYNNQTPKHVENSGTFKKILICFLTILLIAFYVLSFQFLLSN